MTEDEKLKSQAEAEAKTNAEVEKRRLELEAEERAQMRIIAEKRIRLLVVCSSAVLLASIIIGGLIYLSAQKTGAKGGPAAQAQADLGNAPTKFLLPGGVELAMVKIKAGMFLMGSPSGEKGRFENEDEHRVTISKPFLIGKYEVTQGQWQAVMGNNPSRFKGGDRPVESVSWDDAKKFCNRLNVLYAGKLPKGYCFDLPTEAQWEYACRAGTNTALNSGRDLTSEEGTCSNLDEVGWYGENSGETTHAVGRKRPNAWGIYDMHGNVWEWCRDWYGDYNGDATDPTGPVSGSRRVGRGGSWILNAKFCRSAVRGLSDPGGRGGNLGFRLALVPVK